MPENELHLAIAAIKAGDKERGRSILERVIKQQPKNEVAWLWLATCANSNKEKCDCLRKVVEINPANQNAQKALDRLSPLLEVPTFEDIVLNEKPIFDKSKQKVTTDVPVNSNQIKKSGSLVTYFLLGGLALLILTFIVIIGVSFIKKIGPLAAIDTPINTLTPIPTQIVISTPTPNPTHTVSPTHIPPTPIPFTSTPLPIQFIETGNIINGEPQDYILVSSDLPDGYEFLEKDSGPMSNELLSSVKDNPNEYLAMIQDWGRESGYLVLYYNSGINPYEIDSNIVKMKTIDGASKYYKYAQDERDSDIPVLIPPIGDESFSGLRTVNGSQIYEIFFRKDNMLSITTVSGKGEVILSDCIKYAKITEARLIGDEKPGQLFVESTISNGIVQRNETKQIGPILDDFREEQFTLEITLENYQFSKGSDYNKAKDGRIFVIVNLNIKNLGPDTSRSIYSSDFKFRDANGAIQGDSFTFLTDCDFPLTDLTPGGSMKGCVSFEIPETGRVDLIYAPYQYEGLKEGRYLQFTIRE